MKVIIKLFGILIIFAGISLLVKSEIIVGCIENNMLSTWLYIAAILVRLALGIMFLVVAKESLYPGVIRIFAYLFILAAIILFFIGHSNFQDLIGSIILLVNPYAPFVGLLAIIFGIFLVYVFSRKKKLE
nr:hypothetical protein [uncultured Marinifilum sp.]